MAQQENLTLVMSPEGFIDVINADSFEVIGGDRLMEEFMCAQYDVGCEFDEKIEAPPRA